MFCNPQRRIWPLTSSPVPAREAFVYFDELHCRGADLKLHPQAKALVTLSAQLEKDALMQAMGRMRGLHFGQSLELTALPSVQALITQGRPDITVPPDADVLPQDVLNFVLSNSVKSVGSSLQQWALQGCHFDKTCLTQTEATRSGQCRVKDEVGLSAIYEGATRITTVLDAHNSRNPSGGPPPPGTVSKGIGSHLSRFGRDVTVATSGLDEECEREFEHEQEEELEQEVQYPRATPREETDWPDWNIAFCVGRPQELPRSVGVQPLSMFLRQTVPGLEAIQWDQGRVFITANCSNTVNEGQFLASYLRPVDWMLSYPTGECLLLSDREADHVLRLFARSHCDSAEKERRLPGVALSQLALLVCPLPYPGSTPDDALAGRSHSLLLPPVPAPGPATLCPGPPGLAIATAHIFNGGTVFPCFPFETLVEDLLSTLLPDATAANAVKKLCSIRGFPERWPESDLERACDVLLQRFHDSGRTTTPVIDGSEVPVPVEDELDSDD